MKKSTLAKLGTYFATFILVVSGQSTPVQAVIVTFEYGTTDELSLQSYTEDGMTFSTADHFHNKGAGTSGGIYFHSHAVDSPIMITLGGAPFDLISIDVTLATSYSNSTLPTFTANNGSVVGGPWTLGTFIFPAGWTGIKSVIWDVEEPLLGGETMAIDNLVFSPSTPIPAPPPLFFMGFGLVGLGLWRRKLIEGQA